MKTSQFHSARVCVALAALWLAACGGGGGGSEVTVAPGAAPAPVASGPAAPTPPAAAGPATVVTSDTPLAVNTTYNVSTPAAGTVTLTLPASAAANDTMSITGTSATSWVIAQNAGQSIVTTGLNGNVAPGTGWTPRMAPKVWHWLSSDTTGQVLLAGEAAGGMLNTSVDGGQTWTNGNSPNGVWISSDMSATGDRMVAVQYEGGMYMSIDRGATWTRVTSSPLVNNAAGLGFESVTMSADGQRIAAVIQNGRLVVSNDAGGTWTAPTLPVSAGTTQNLPWRSIDSSADGSVIVAASQDGQLFRSTDRGATFTLIVDPASGTNPVPVDNWYRVKLSADGKTIALVGNTYGGAPGRGIYVSHDQGTTWTTGFALTIDYTSLAVSADGTTIAATASTTGTTPGRVLLSTNGGTSFAPITPAGTEGVWRAVALSSDGNKLAVAAGKFDAKPDPYAGQLYTSLGNRTSVGTTGSITGGQNASVTLRYVGNGQWAVQSSSGGPFTIR